MDWTDSLPLMDTLAMPTVFQDAADVVRTDGRLAPRVRRLTGQAERRQYRNARRQAAADSVLDRLPDPGEAIHVCLDGSFDLCHIIPRITELAGAAVEQLDLSTLGFNDTTIDILARLSDAGTIGSIRLLASHYFRSVDTTLWQRAHHELTSRGHTLYVCRTHAKIHAYKFADGRTVTLLSSANLRSCKNAEFAVLFGDAGTFEFWRGIIDELIEESRKCVAESRS